MAWFGESLSSLTGHLQNLTKEVLSEASDETKGASGDLEAAKEKLEELEAVCTAQDLEISALKKQNAELRRRLEQAGGLEDEGQVVLPPAPTTWLSIEQRCDAAYAAGANGHGGATASTGRGHARALSDATAVSAKHQERLEKELKDRIQLIEHLQLQLQKVEEERHQFYQRTFELEQQVQQLSQQSTVDETMKGKEVPASQNEQKLIQENSELKSSLNEANKRTKELEEELLSMRNQCLDHVIDSQINTSELRSDVEQTRKRIASEAGAQRAEKLRAHQDMVNRMIQMGEKSWESEQNMKRLQAEDKKLAADMALKIQKLGDQEQQDLIHGTLKALELENQVLNMRNAQLERETMKDLGIKNDERKPVPDGIEFRPRSEAMKYEDDDNIALQSELLDLTIPNQRLENQIAQLQNQVEIYKRDIKHYEMVRDDLSCEKLELEEQVKSLKKQLKEKHESPNSVLLQSASTSLKTTEQNKLINEVSEEKLKEFEQEFEKLKGALDTMREEKHCLGQELEAMARVVQDLEASVASGEQERRELETSMEELDQQHQDAIDKLLGLRNAELAENEQLKSEVQDLKMAAVSKPTVSERVVQTEVESSVVDCFMQTDSIQQNDQENQTSLIYHDKDTQTEFSEKQETDNDSENLLLNDVELSNKIRNLVNFDLPTYTNLKIPQSLHLVQEIVKIVHDCKWKKDTLERKVAELIRENKEYKSTITILETECSSLKENVERLAEQLVGVGKSNSDALPTILENSEEMEALEQRNALLEEEIAVLRETRLNLEEDAVRMREDREDLLGRIRNLEAQQKNHENLNTELQRHVEDAENSIEAFKAAADMADQARITAENRAKSLAHELENNTQHFEKQLAEIQEHARCLDTKNSVLLSDIEGRESEIAKLKNLISRFETEKNSLIYQLQENTHSKEIERLVEENKTLRNRITDLQAHLEDTSNLKVEIAEVSRNLEEATKAKLELERQFNFTTRNLHDAQSLLEERMDVKENCSKWQLSASTEEVNAKDAFESVSRLEEENRILQDKIKKEQKSVKDLNLEKEKLLKEIEDLKGKMESELIWVNNRQLSLSYEDLNSEITSLKKEKINLEESLASALQQQDSLKLECESQQSVLLQMEQIETQLRETISALRVQANDAERKLQTRYESEYSEIVRKLKEENERLNQKISVPDTIWSTPLQLTDHINSCESLDLVLHEKEILVKENSKLKAALSKYISSSSLHIARENFHPSLSEETHSVASDSLEIMNKRKLEEQQMTSNSSENKNREIETLQTQVNELITVLAESNEKVKKVEQLNEIITEEKLQCEEKLEMTKETVSKLSEIIMEKDQELLDVKDKLSQLSVITLKVDDLNKQLQQAHEFRAQAIQERDRLLQTVHVKHQESIQYHTEIQRLSTLLSQELAKNQQLVSQYTALVQQHNEERENASPKHQQELKELQDLIKVKDDGLQQLCNRLELKEQELQARGMELETLQHQMGIMCQERAQISAAASGRRDEESQEKYKELLSKFQDEQRRGKTLLNELETCQGREIALQKELERLRIHLVEIEDTYTQEALKSEERMKELTGKLLQAEDMMKSSSTVYKSANIRANQQVETLQEQARLIAQQRDDVQLKLSAAEDQVAKHAAALRNLQAVLEQFQRDREREIEAAKESVYVKVEAAQSKSNEFLGEISSLKMQLNQAKEGLSAASRLGEELEKKTEVVNRLKQEVVQLEEKALKAEENAKTVGQTVEGKVDKSLVKNVVLGFFLAPSNSKEQVLHVVASVLDFSEDEKSRVHKILGFHGSEGSGGWFKSLLHPTGQEQKGNTQSLSEAFVRFLENESIPQPRLKMLPEAERPSANSSNSPRATTPNNTQRKSPLLLADVQLPTFAQFQVGRNSSSILKDILKES